MNDTLINEDISIGFEEDSFKKKIIQKDVREWSKKVFKELKIKDKSCSILFTGFDTIQKLNNKYRKKNSITDVLSFSQEEGIKVEGNCFLGDIVICIPQAALQAKRMGHSFKSEISFLLLHGLLHLCGYDHEKDEGQMSKIEKKIYKKLTGEILVDLDLRS